MEAVPSVLPPLRKLTDPVGIAPPADGVRVAVRMTGWPVDVEEGETASAISGRGLLLTTAPVPCNATVVEAPVLMVSVPVREPAAAGLKATLMVQLWPMASEAPQLLVPVNSAEAVAPPKASADAPVLVMTSGMVALVDPVAWVPKVSVAAEMANGGGVATA